MINWKSHTRDSGDPFQVLPVARMSHLSHSSAAHESSIHTIPKIVYGSAVEPQYITSPPSWKVRKDFIWARIQARPKYGSFILPRRKQSHPGVNMFVTLDLAPVSSLFQMSGGAINKIIQNHGCIAVSSATPGGQPDDPANTAQPQDLYNREGTLQIWQDDGKNQSSTILHGHCVLEESHEPTCYKCFTVNDISFDPNQSNLMASAGNDGYVQLWEDGRKLDNGHYEYPMAPHDVVYRAKDSLLAVTCRDGSIYVHHTQSPSYWPLRDPVHLCVAPPDVQHSVGAIAWGGGASADSLFASSEAQHMGDYSGFHLAFDPDQGRCAYEFNIKESARLALFTTTCDRNALDNFYPSLSPSQSEPREGEVTTASFSPDGLLLAVARSDDELHVYDSRFMGRSSEPMRRFLHWDDDCCTGGDRWGIVDAIWVDGWCGRGLGVVTGGTDGEVLSCYRLCAHLFSICTQGCIRFWDVCRSADDIRNGEVIARPNSDIGHFSVGDPHNGEKPLVVGDNGGRVYVYDHATACNSFSSMVSN
ncbi:WD40-repeat-containing domain protein [Multifurca ochricompacta]|uniref:WD40-repeat-containing domain protein n=1 Tax=Multifurca ochricompacta TaxID=376703 RepID=A0AAD4QTD0_9AGAM|nr:WD40-repeat-containing domain protein [Multifurca ochricompacta]